MLLSCRQPIRICHVNLNRVISCEPTSVEQTREFRVEIREITGQRERVREVAVDSASADCVDSEEAGCIVNDDHKNAAATRSRVGDTFSGPSTARKVCEDGLRARPGNDRTGRPEHEIGAALLVVLDREHVVGKTGAGDPILQRLRSRADGKGRAVDNCARRLDAGEVDRIPRRRSR